MALPVLTPEQKREALKKAQEVRSKRAKVREDLKSGKISLENIFEDVEDRSNRKNESSLPSRIAAENR